MKYRLIANTPLGLFMSCEVLNESDVEEGKIKYMLSETVNQKLTNNLISFRSQDSTSATDHCKVYIPYSVAQQSVFEVVPVEEPPTDPPDPLRYVP